MGSSSDFHINEPRASAQLGSNEIIVFGGTGNYSYLVELAQMLASKSVGSVSTGGANVRITRIDGARLLLDSQFCMGTDFTIKTFGNFMYAVDTVKRELHVCSIKERQWNFS